MIKEKIDQSKKQLVGVVSLGYGNISSICTILNLLSVDHIVLKSIIDYRDEITHLILPGVGSFDYGMQALRQHKLDSLIQELVKSRGIPILGICLGMQLLCSSSDEGECTGLDLIGAKVKKISTENYKSLKIPHVGWRWIEHPAATDLFPDPMQKLRFYFTHSFVVSDPTGSFSIASVDYGEKLCAAFQHEKIFGVQFHPEKSHEYGINVFKNFLKRY